MILQFDAFSYAHSSILMYVRDTLEMFHFSILYQVVFKLNSHFFNLFNLLIDVTIINLPFFFRLCKSVISSSVCDCVYVIVFCTYLVYIHFLNLKNVSLLYFVLEDKFIIIIFNDILFQIICHSNIDILDMRI